MSTIKTEVNGSVVTVTVEGFAPLQLNVEALTPEVRMRALTDRVRNKLLDAGALSRNPDSGKPATAQEKYDAILAVHQTLTAGLWEQPRASGEPKGGLLFRAMCEAFPGKFADAKAFKGWIEEQAKAQKRTVAQASDALAANPRVKPIIERMKAAAAKGIDSDAMLKGLDGTAESGS